MSVVTVCSDFGAQKNNIYHYFYFFHFYLPWGDITIEKDKYFNRKISKGHEKEVYDKRKIKRVKSNKGDQLH